MIIIAHNQYREPLAFDEQITQQFVFLYALILGITITDYTHKGLTRLRKYQTLIENPRKELPYCKISYGDWEVESPTTSLSFTFLISPTIRQATRQQLLIRWYTGTVDEDHLPWSTTITFWVANFRIT